jgi:hypothetical protein
MHEKLSYEKIYNQSIKYIPYKEDWNNKYNTHLQDIYFKTFPKRKKYDRDKIPSSSLDEAWKEWHTLAQKLSSIYDRRGTLLKNLLSELSKTDIDIIPQKEKMVLYSCETYKYSTQSNCVGYAYGDAKMELNWIIALNLHGVEASIVNNTRSEYGRYGSNYYGSFDVMANLLPWQWHYLQNHTSMSLMDWCISCWNSGINPKVRNPFIPDEVYEKSMILRS